jgi:hypothetical protein
MPPCRVGGSRSAPRALLEWERVATASCQWTRPQRQRRTRCRPPHARVRRGECQSRAGCTERTPTGACGQAGLRFKVHTPLFAAAACVVLTSGGGHAGRPSGMHPVPSATIIPAAPVPAAGPVPGSNDHPGCTGPSRRSPPPGWSPGAAPPTSVTVGPAGSPVHASRGSRRHEPETHSNVSRETPGSALMS